MRLATILCLPVIVGGCSFDTAGLAADTTSLFDGPTAVDAARDLAEPRADGAADAHHPEQPETVVPPGWRHCKQVTVSAAMATQTLTDFPMLLRIDNELDLASGAREDGSDIIFVAGDLNERYVHEIELYDGSTGSLVAWVKLPSLSHLADTQFYLCYGNDAPPPARDPALVWSNGYAGVWHLSGITVVDSGPHHRTATTSGGVAEVAGRFAHGRQFDTQAISWIKLGDPALVGPAPFTMALWFRPNSAQFDWIGLMTKGRLSNTEWAGIWLSATQLLTFGWSWKDPGQGNLDSAGIYPAPGEWHQAVATFDGSAMNLYFNGVVDANSPQLAGYGEIAEATVLGTDLFAANPSFDGVIDEVRLSSVARSPAWIAAQFANQDDPATHLTVGPQLP